MTDEAIEPYVIRVEIDPVGQGVVLLLDEGGVKALRGVLDEVLLGGEVFLGDNESPKLIVRLAPGLARGLL